MTQPDTQDIHISSSSESDSFSDSEWLDIASNRESDNESVSSHNGGASSSLSRRSSFSSSSRDGEIEAWEGFVEGSSDDEEAANDDSIHAATLQDDGPTGSPFIDLDRDNAEELRVRDGLEQSMMSTLSASRSSSHPSTMQNSLRDLRLSFPDPLTSTRDELNRSYDKVSPSEATLPVKATATEDDEHEHELAPSVAMTESIPMQDPGSPPTPEVLDQDSSPNIPFNTTNEAANLQVVLYGASSPNEWTFVRELLRKATVGGAISGIENTPETLRMKPVVLDQADTAGATPRSDNTPDRASLAIVFLPHTPFALPEHSSYLPVVVFKGDDSFEKDFKEAQQVWSSYDISPDRVLRLEGSGSGLLFAAEDVDELDPVHTHKAFQRLIKQEKPVSWFGLLEQFNTVHAVTLFALLCLIAGFSVNTALGVRPLKGLNVLPPSPTIVAKDHANQSSAIAVRTTSSISVVPAAINYAPAVYNRGSTPASGRTSSTASSSRAESRAAGPITQLEGKLMTWAERMKSTTEVMIRPSTSLVPAEVESEASTSALPVTATSNSEESSTAVSVRLVDSLSEFVTATVKAINQVVDMNDVILALDECLRAIHRSTQMVAEQSKTAVQIVREKLEYRHDRAKDKARQIKEKGMQIFSYAGNNFLGRTKKAKQRAQSIKDQVTTSDAWASYSKSHGEWRDKLSQRTRHARNRVRRQERVKRRHRVLDVL